jgi:hypothetical protein
MKIALALHAALTAAVDKRAEDHDASRSEANRRIFGLGLKVKALCAKRQ